MEGATFQTFIGGFTSILLNILIMVYMAYKFKIMIFNENNKIEFSEVVRNSEQTKQNYHLN
jgi:hypothetical protein